MLKNVELADLVKVIFYLKTVFRTLKDKTTGMKNKTQQNQNAGTKLVQKQTPTSSYAFN